jgi:hypothetical protein
MAPGTQGALQYAASHGLDPNQAATFAAQIRDLQSPSLNPAVMAQTAEIAARNIQGERDAQLRRQQIGAQSQQANDANAIRRSQLDLDARRTEIDGRIRGRAQDIAARSDDRRMRLAETQEGKRFSDRERADETWNLESAKVLENDVREMLKAARAIEYTPEGKREYARLAAEGRAIQASRSKMRPAQYAQLLGQFMERFEQSDLGSLQAAPKSLKEKLADDSFDLGTGYMVFRQPDGRYDVKRAQDEASKIANADLKKAELEMGAALLPPEMEAGKTWSDPKTGRTQFLKDVEDAKARLAQKWSVENPDSDQIEPPAFSPEQIEEEMLEPYRMRHRMLQRFSQGQGAAPGAPAAQGGAASHLQGVPAGPGDMQKMPPGFQGMFGNQPQPGQQPTAQPASQQGMMGQGPIATPDQQIAYQLENFMQKGRSDLVDRPEAARIQERLNAVGSTKTWYDLITEDAVAAYIEEGSKDPFGDLIEHVDAMLKVDGFNIEDVPPDMQLKMEQTLPTVMTASQYEKLEPGKIFIDGATGKIVRKPVKGVDDQPKGKVKRAPTYTPDPRQFPGVILGG